MNKIKRLTAIFLSTTIIMSLCTCGIYAETEVQPADTGTEELSLDEKLAQGLDKVYSSEVPEDFFLIPKEKMVIEGWDWDFAFLHDKINKGELSWEIFEPLYAYIAIVINHDYLELHGIKPEEFQLDFSTADLDTMFSYYFKAIKRDQFSINLAESYRKYDPADFEKDAELTECIVRACYTFCTTAGIKPEDFWSHWDLELWYDLSPEKITFSDEQLHYFDA